MAAIFRPQTETELRAALASKCNFVLDPVLKATCLQVAATGPITAAPPARSIPTWAVYAAAGAAAFLLWRTLR